MRKYFKNTRVTEEDVNRAVACKREWTPSKVKKYFNGRKTLSIYNVIDMDIDPLDFLWIIATAFQNTSFWAGGFALLPKKRGHFYSDAFRVCFILYGEEKGYI